MLNLIKNELKKVFKKKSMIVLFIIALGFIFLTNFIYKTFTNSDGVVIDLTKNNDISYYENEIKYLDLDNDDDLLDYIAYKTEISTLKLLKDYKDDSWQYYVVSNVIHDTIYNINTYSYGKEKNKEKVEEYNNVYNKQIENLKKGDYKIFIKEELKHEEENLKQKELLLTKETNKKKISTLKNDIEISKLMIEKLNYRLDEDINYSDNYLNRALDTYYSFKIDDLSYDESSATYQQKVSHNEKLKEMANNKYALTHKVNTLNEGSSRGILINFFSEYEMIIVVAIVMIAGSIVSEEFSKGTIKLLLIRPHSRSKILLSKLLSTIISILIISFIMVLLQLIVGGIFFGFNSLNIPAVIYNFNKDEIETINVFVYLIIKFITILPKFILIASLAFMISTIFKNTALATMVGIFGYIASSIVNALVIGRDLKIFKYSVTLNWNLGDYLFGGLPEFKYISLPFSILICILYLVLLLVPTFIIFKKINIKNT